MHQINHYKKLNRIFSNPSRKLVIVPLDDSLLAGPINGLENLKEKILNILSAKPDAVMGFQGLFKNYYREIGRTPTILNLTGSTTRNTHTRKALIGSLELATIIGVEAIAVHVNISSKYETEMLKILGIVSTQCHLNGMPLMAIMYPRTENKDGSDNNYDTMKVDKNKEYTELVAHSVRVGVEFGADIIKTQYTGDSESFSKIVDAANPIPIIIAGGPKVGIKKMLDNAEGAVKAGGAGISFGRNIYTRKDTVPFINAVKEIVHNNKSSREVETLYNLI